MANFVMKNDRIAIPLNKKMIINGLLISIIMMLMGIIFMIAPHEFDGPPKFIRAFGIFCILLFGYMFFKVINNGIGKLLYNKAGLIIDSDGITDNSGIGASASGVYIPWEDIIGIETKSHVTVGTVKIIAINVNNPDEYINRQKSLKKNYDCYGSPVCLTAALLDCKPEELELILREQYEKYKFTKFTPKRDEKAGRRIV